MIFHTQETEFCGAPALAVVFNLDKQDPVSIWNMLQDAFPDNRKPGQEYYGLHCYGAFENAITFIR